MGRKEAVGCAIHIVGIMPLLEYAEGVGRPLCILEGFVYFCCERYTISAVFLGIVFLVSDIPFSSENETYTLLRVSRKKWLVGKVMYLFGACVLFYLAVSLAGMAFLSGNAYAGNFWSEPFYHLAQGMNTGDYSAYFPYPHILLLSPLQAVLIGFALDVAYGFVMSLFLFFCNLKLSRNLGYAAVRFQDNGGDKAMRKSKNRKIISRILDRRAIMEDPEILILDGPMNAHAFLQFPFPLFREKIK